MESSSLGSESLFQDKHICCSEKCVYFYDSDKTASTTDKFQDHEKKPTRIKNELKSSEKENKNVLTRVKRKDHHEIAVSISNKTIGIDNDVPHKTISRKSFTCVGPTTI